MINEVIFKIKQDRKLYNYLKYHSYWYYVITYDKDKVKDLIKEMKIELKETTEDKVLRLNKNLEFIKSMLDLMV